MSYQGHYGNGKRRSGAWKIVLAVVLTVIITLALVVGVLLWYVKSKVSKVTQAEFVEQDTTEDVSKLLGNFDDDDISPDSTVPETSEATEPEETEPEATEADYGQSGRVVNILVVGQDYRAGEDHKLADGIMLLTLDKEARTLTMTSFLRDSYVDLPDYYRGHTCGWNRINTAYALGYAWYGNAGAMEMLDLTLENNFGVTVDGNIEVSFETFTDVVDYLGGVEIDLEGDEYTKMCEFADLYNEQYGLTGTDDELVLVEGVNNLNGYMALYYAREREVNASDNDMNRVKRQQKVLTKMLEKCTQLSVLELNNLIDFILGEIITDISAEDLEMYITELTPYLFDLTMVSNQCPADGTYYGEMVELPDGLSGVLKIDFNANKKLLEPIINGEVSAEEVEAEGTTPASEAASEETAAEETATEEATTSEAAGT